MKTRHKIVSILGFVAGLLLLGAGCSKDETDSMAAETFEIAEENLSYDFTQGQEMVFIPVRTNIPESSWRIDAPNGSWCKISKSYNNQTGLMLAVESSDEPEVRTATAKVSAGGRDYEIRVRQLGYGPAILVADKTVSAAGGDIELSVTANIDFTVGMPVTDEVDDAGWITRDDSTPETRAFAATRYNFRVQKNTIPFERLAKITVRAMDPVYASSSVDVTITQQTPDVTPADIPDDTRVYATGATADQWHEGSGPEKLVDDLQGDNDGYHSPWGLPHDNPTTVFPVTLEISFDGMHDIDYCMIHYGAATNGLIGKFDLLYKSQDDVDYRPLNDETNRFDLRRQGNRQTVYFPQTLEKITSLKFVIYDGSGDNGAGNGEGFVAAREIEFYQSAQGSLNEALLDVFTDLSCSELKPEATRREIVKLNSLSPFIAKEAAVRLLQNRYDEFEKGFRAQSYKAYSDNAINSQLLTRKYSRMDNPTGIEVKTGDVLIVCVDKVPANQRLSLAVYGEASDGYGPNYGGMADSNNNETVDQETTLIAGMNSIAINRPGMCYVMNTATPLTAASEPVKVHILPRCGTVQGYFDLERHQTDEVYRNLLSSTTYKYFVAKGKKMIFNFHTSQLRVDSPSGIVSGLQAWDDIVTWQQELMGIEDAEYFNNHIMAVSSTHPDAYMDASNRRVNFSATTALYKIISLEQLLAEEDNAWGPAHELGHVNQGAINWKSCSESSNNLFSNYAIYKMGKYGSRGDALSELALSWVNKETWALMGGSTHQNEDTELHMRLNWQLWNYFHRCGYDTEFWPKFFQLLREDPMPSEFSGAENPGACQLHYAERACDAAKLDLTEFFETWGFYRPIDITYEQYGSARYRVTDDMIDASKARIAAKGYPKAPPIQYIEDRTSKNGIFYCDMGYYTTFQNKTQITKTPTYTVSGRTYTVSNCDQAVAVELRKNVSGTNLGTLVYFSNVSTFTVPEGADLTGVSLYAVQYDGERKPINQ